MEPHTFKEIYKQSPWLWYYTWWLTVVPVVILTQGRVDPLDWEADHH